MKEIPTEFSVIDSIAEALYENIHCEHKYINFPHDGKVWWWQTADTAVLALVSSCLNEKWYTFDAKRIPINDLIKIIKQQAGKG